ncbi:MAG TPA: MraY family glycosyltransferase [Steroidobacteraceae bacterium]|nr:MraY family glycosyltransferase [Steroidobacteraceae bacterium]
MELFLAFIVALSTTAALIPVLSRWAPAVGLTDKPGPRKVHVVPVPRVGGLAMAIGILLPVLVTVPLTGPTRGVLLGILILLCFGVWDDRVELGYRTKLVGQILAVGVCMVVGDVHIGRVMIDGRMLAPGLFSGVITFLFLIGVTNAVNLTDGLDGLAGGLVLLCLCAVALFAVASGNSSVIALCLIEAGAVLGFLRFNTHPARIFMGDSGSQVLGFSVGALALLATQGVSGDLSAALPILLLGLPILDTLMVMSTRIMAGKSPFTADKNHLHHRLLAIGFVHREAVAIVYLLQAGLVLLAYFMRFEADLTVVAVFCAFAVVVLGLLLLAKATGWHLRNPQAPGHIRSPLNLLPTVARLPAIALGVMLACLMAYAATVLVVVPHVGKDLGVLSLAMLAVLLLLSFSKAHESLHWFERTATYVSVVLLVYLDQTALDHTQALAAVSWTLIGITGAAALVRFWLSPTRRFEVTTLDLIVVFVALVLPNLPGSLQLPPDLPQGIAKSVILLYVVEMLLTFDLKRSMPRLILGAMLVAIAGRAFIGAAA